MPVGPLLRRAPWDACCPPRYHIDAGPCYTSSIIRRLYYIIWHNIYKTGIIRPETWNGITERAESWLGCWRPWTHPASEVKAAKPTLEATRRLSAWNWASSSVREMVDWSPSFWTSACNAFVISFSLFSANKPCTETYDQKVGVIRCIQLTIDSIILTSCVTEWRRPLYGIFALNRSTISANDFFGGGCCMKRRWLDSI